MNHLDIYSKFPSNEFIWASMNLQKLQLRGPESCGVDVGVSIEVISLNSGSSASKSNENTLFLVYGRKPSKSLYSKSTLCSHLKNLTRIAEKKMQNKDFVGAHPNVHYYRCVCSPTTSFSTYPVIVPGFSWTGSAKPVAPSEQFTPSPSANQ